MKLDIIGFMLKHGHVLVDDDRTDELFLLSYWMRHHELCFEEVQ